MKSKAVSLFTGQPIFYLKCLYEYMETKLEHSVLDDRRIKVLNFLLQKHKIPESDEFNLKELIDNIPAEDYKKILAESPEFEEIWRRIDMSKSLSQFLIDNGLAMQTGDKLELTTERGKDLKKQGSYGKLLEDERYITSEARRVNELELEADRMYRRQYGTNLLIMIGTSMAALYYILEILDGFFGIFKYHHN